MVICCRKDSPDTDVPEDKAGKFGHDHCDLPPITAESFVNEVQKLQPDLIFWLGDNPAHDVYDQKKETQMNHFLFIAGLLKKQYKGKVYTILGNHESYPMSQFDFRTTTHTWLTESYAKEMLGWVDEKGKILIS